VLRPFGGGVVTARVSAMCFCSFVHLFVVHVRNRYHPDRPQKSAERQTVMTQRHAISNTKFEFGVVGDIGRFWSASGISFSANCV
jgi:hypothetical protein